MKSPILITGCARSGTSLVAGIINICGAFGGDMSGPNRYNEKGMFENAKIRHEIVKPFLRSINADPSGQYPLPVTKEIPLIPTWKETIENVMIEQGISNGDPWMYKGAKMTLNWSVWHHAFPDAKWIIVRRKTPDIINSCIKTGFMSAFSLVGNQKAVGVDSEYDGWYWWVQRHIEKWQEMIHEGVNIKVVWPERMVDGNYAQMKETIEWLGLEWKGQDVMNFIEPKLWKARKK